MERAIKGANLFTNEGRKWNHMDKILQSSAKAKKFPFRLLNLWAWIDLWSTCKLEQEHSMLMPWHPKWSAKGTQMDLWAFLWNFVVTILQLLLSKEDCLCHDFRSAPKLIWISKLIFFRYLFVLWLQTSPEILSTLVLVVVEIEENRQWH